MILIVFKKKLKNIVAKLKRNNNSYVELEFKRFIDEMNDEGLYIFEGKADGDEVEVKNVESEEEYIAVAEAYCDFEE